MVTGLVNYIDAVPKEAIASIKNASLVTSPLNLEE